MAVQVLVKFAPALPQSITLPPTAALPGTLSTRSVPCELSDPFILVHPFPLLLGFEPAPSRVAPKEDVVKPQSLQAHGSWRRFGLAVAGNARCETVGR
jgi:hypothetical protein